MIDKRTLLPGPSPRRASDDHLPAPGRTARMIARLLSRRAPDGQMPGAPSAATRAYALVRNGSRVDGAGTVLLRRDASPAGAADFPLQRFAARSVPQARTTQMAVRRRGERG